MTRERREQVEQLSHAAWARVAGERTAFLDAACAGDAALRREVESLLAQRTSAADGLLDRAAWPSLLDEPSVALLAPGAQLGPYQILSLLGTGGMGQVYKAFDARLRREVAIKVAGERFSERFDREVRAVASLNHPNICTLHDVGPNYLVMELIEGETLCCTPGAIKPTSPCSVFVARSIPHVPLATRTTPTITSHACTR